MLVQLQVCGEEKGTAKVLAFQAFEVGNELYLDAKLSNPQT